jgi:hypothetical protein
MATFTHHDGRAVLIGLPRAARKRGLLAEQTEEWQVSRK